LQWTALMGAAYCGHVAVARVLLDLGASLDLRDSEGGTALYLAADRCKADVVTLLLQRGADPSLKARGGLNALMAASFGGHVCAVRVLLGQGGQRVDERSEYGQTALWWACANGAAEVRPLTHWRSCAVGFKVV
jgi:ankyrin repeat protein